MRLTGYSDRVWMRPGESLAFHIHSESADVDYQLVRLLHGDENPRGPGFQCDPAWKSDPVKRGIGVQN